MISTEEHALLAAFANVSDLPRAHSGPCGSGTIRGAPVDFQVSEFTGIEPSGEGEHLWIRVRKTGQNTRWVARALAESLDLPYKAVSFAGMKDRHAVAEQWLSAHMPGRSAPDLTGLGIEGVEILESARHNHKLRPGQLSYNRFQVVLRSGGDIEPGLFSELVPAIVEHGFPNYFGAQRFGRGGANLGLARDLDELRGLGREARSFFLSSVRGALFNGYLAERIRHDCWATPLPGEAEISNRTRGPAEDDRSLFEPSRQPSGLLWGKGMNAARGDALERDTCFFAAFPGVTSLLEAAGSRMSRRVLSAQVADFSFAQHDDAVELKFALGPGVFATAMLRELFDFDDGSPGNRQG